MELKSVSVRELALYLSHHLRKEGIDSVLSGGACVCIYTDNKYLSYDLDYVLMSYEDHKKTGEVLEKIGFFKEGKYFKHKNSPYAVEFLSPPLSVGAEPVREISVIEEAGKSLKLLSPTDCVKDRLAAYYHWNDKQSLEQALLVYRDNPVDLTEVERWSKNEEMERKFLEFRAKLKFS